MWGGGKGESMKVLSVSSRVILLRSSYSNDRKCAVHPTTGLMAHVLQRRYEELHRTDISNQFCCFLIVGFLMLYERFPIIVVFFLIAVRPGQTCLLLKIDNCDLKLCDIWAKKRIRYTFSGDLPTAVTPDMEPRRCSMRVVDAYSLAVFLPCFALPCRYVHGCIAGRRSTEALSWPTQKKKRNKIAVACAVHFCLSTSVGVAREYML